MKYEDGREVLLGDRVDLGSGMLGVVVAVVDVAQYSPEYPLESWSYLKEGALLESDGFGLLHCTSSDHDFALVARGAHPDE